MSVRVTVGDMEFNDDSRHTDPVRRSLKIDAGWDSTDADDEALPTIGEGSARGRVMRRHRTIVCSGVIETKSNQAWWQEWEALENLVPLYEDTTFVVHQPNGARMCHVHAAPGTPRMEDIDGLSIRYQLTLIANDPTKYPVEETP